MAIRSGLLWLVCLVCLPSGHAAAESPEVGLWLKHGSFVSGKLLASSGPGRIALQCDAFDEPLEFDIGALSSIDKPADEQVSPAGGFLFTLTNGSTLAGKLVVLDETRVTIESPALGRVSFPRSLLYSFSSANVSGQIIYTGPRRSAEWTSAGQPGDWSYEAGAMVTSKVGVGVWGDVKLEEKCQVHVSMSWPKSPNFELALGCTKVNAPAEKVLAALRLEVWDGSLVMVREVDKASEFVVIPTQLSQNPQLDLILYLDQIKGLAAAYTPTGRLLAKLELKAAKAIAGSFVSLRNYAPATEEPFRLDRFDVRAWDGHLPNEWSEVALGVLDEGGQLHTGQLGELDSASGDVSIIGEDEKQTTISLHKIHRAMLRAVTDLEDGISDSSIELLLSDQSHIVGNWLGSKSDKIEFELKGLDEPLRFPMATVISGTGSAATFEVSKLPGRRGTLKSGAATLTGCLIDSEREGTLFWQAEGATKPVALSPQATGKIEYEQAPTPPVSVSAPPQNIERLGINLLIRGNVVNRSGLRPAPSETKQVELGLKLRSGDEVAGQVKSIDQRGVTFSSDETSATFVPHEQMDAVTLYRKRPVNSESPEKLKRLLTVPRASKLDPPTHLLLSIKGDYLRGRLVQYDGDHVVVEVRSENVELPADQIAQIFWLHSRDWDSSQEPAAPAASPTLQVHTIRKSGRSMTFTPISLSARILKGKSEILGDCEVDVDDLRSLLFGRDVGAQVRESRDDAWKLSLATLPKVYQEGGVDAGSHSPLVGQPAPDFTLETTSGGRLKLTELRGRVVVLDFWASWCGPCMQTMPEVERIVKEVGGDKVDLVAVNLQETKERISSAIKRLDLSATVALDSDGEVAQLYQATAIPQTVIIDREGKVTHLFIGGGPRFLKEFADSLTATLAVAP